MDDAFNVASAGLIDALNSAPEEKAAAEKRRLYEKNVLAQALFDQGLNPLLGALAALPEKNGLIFKVEEVKGDGETVDGPSATVTLRLKDEGPPAWGPVSTIKLEIPPNYLSTEEPPGNFSDRAIVFFESRDGKSQKTLAQAGKAIGEWVTVNAPDRVHELKIALEKMVKERKSRPSSPPKFGRPLPADHPSQYRDVFGAPKKN